MCVCGRNARRPRRDGGRGTGRRWHTPQARQGRVGTRPPPPDARARWGEMTPRRLTAPSPPRLKLLYGRLRSNAPGPGSGVRPPGPSCLSVSPGRNGGSCQARAVRTRTGAQQQRASQRASEPARDARRGAATQGWAAGGRPGWSPRRALHARPAGSAGRAHMTAPQGLCRACRAGPVELSCRRRASPCASAVTAFAIGSLRAAPVLDRAGTRRADPVPQTYECRLCADCVPTRPADIRVQTVCRHATQT